MPADITDLTASISNPGLYFQKYDFRSWVAIFREMACDAFRDSSFLDDRIVSLSPMQYRFAIEQVMSINPSLSLPPGRLIFHTAYCCSTLLSRALDVAGRTLVYREPVHLHQLAVARRRPTDYTRSVANQWPKLLRFSLSKLFWEWGGCGIPIIKPTDSCNNIIMDILALHESSKAVLLYSQAREFIVSNLKSAGRRQFLRNFLTRSMYDNALDVHSALHLVDASILSDAESAAYVWMTQILAYRKALYKHADQCICIDSAKLMSNPRRVLENCNQFLDLGLHEEYIETVLDSNMWQRHAKDVKRNYSSVDRRDEMAALSKTLEPEIQAGLAWIVRFDGWDPTVRFDREISLTGCG